ncbi:hypothetical protein [Ruegeria sp. HKCCSP335]|uniref:hypothetical protein n=1 Tax=Ruegeria sp. HKCCSP335 TaxID=2794833 RepID=UPI001AE85473|nr:hypothetical protein [Ruegeria sp. HKCCSP335]
MLELAPDDLSGGNLLRFFMMTDADCQLTCVEQLVTIHWLKSIPTQLIVLVNLVHYFIS